MPVETKALHDDMKRLYRFGDLVRLGIVSNRSTLYRWIREERFPRPVRLTEISVAWRRQDVDRWLNHLVDG
jgi:prophage regulatory protein